MELVVGKVGRPHGLRGEVAVEVRTDQPELRFVPGAVMDTGERGKLTVESVRWHQQRLLVRFDGYADRTAAERLRGALLVVDASEDEELADPDEFFDHQLVGLAAVTVSGDPIGEVHEVLHLPMQDVLAVRSEQGGELLIPFVKDVVPEVDTSAGRVVVDPPPGLLTPPADG